MKKLGHVWKSITMMLFCSFIVGLTDGVAEAKIIKPKEDTTGLSNRPIVSSEKKAAIKRKNKDAVKKEKLDPRSEKGSKQANASWRIKSAQQKLQRLGFSKETPSGKMTTATSLALQQFQKQYKLPTTGKLDELTYKKLNWIAFAQTGIKNVQGKDIVQSAAKLKCIPYVWGGTKPSGFDCSGYVQYVFRKHGAELPRLADAQVLKGIFVTQRQLKLGDLVFFSTYEPGASHVGIYAGNGKFWHTSSSRGVMLSSLQDYYWKPRYYGARRVLVSNGEI